MTRTSVPNRMPDDLEMEVWRQSGQFICQCRHPRPQHIHLFACNECRACGKLILGRGGAELLRRVIKAGS